MTIDWNGLFSDGAQFWKDPFHRNGDFPIFIEHRQSFVRSSFHSQPGVEIHFTHEGSGVLLLGRRAILQIPRHVVIFRAEVPHQLTFDPNRTCSRTVLCFEDRYFSGANGASLTDLSWIIDKGSLSFTLLPSDYAEIDALNGKLAQEINFKQPGWQQMACSYLLHIVVRLVRMAHAQHQVHPQSQKESNTKLVQGCLDYIRENLNGDLSLSHLASCFSISPEHLTRVFGKELGISYYQFVLLNRISEAKSMLQKEPELSITDVSLAVGFESSAQFSRAFRKFIGETPSSYRAKIWSDPALTE